MLVRYSRLMDIQVASCIQGKTSKLFAMLLAQSFSFQIFFLIEKQSRGVLYEKRCFQNCCKIHRKALVSERLSKKRLWHKCFPVIFPKYLRTLFYRTPLVAASSKLHLPLKMFIKIVKQQISPHFSEIQKHML